MYACHKGGENSTAVLVGWLLAEQQQGQRGQVEQGEGEADGYCRVIKVDPHRLAHFFGGLKVKKQG